MICVVQAECQFCSKVGVHFIKDSMYRVLCGGGQGWDGKIRIRGRVQEVEAWL